jgi:hypothetical protein
VWCVVVCVRCAVVCCGVCAVCGVRAVCSVVCVRCVVPKVCVRLFTRRSTTSKLLLPCTRPTNVVDNQPHHTTHDIMHRGTGRKPPCRTRHMRRRNSKHQVVRNCNLLCVDCAPTQSSFHLVLSALLHYTAEFGVVPGWCGRVRGPVCCSCACTRPRTTCALPAHIHSTASVCFESPPPLHSQLCIPYDSCHSLPRCLGGKSVGMSVFPLE